ncbi:MAG: M23 family metallopeptidase [Acuticoccus sp.]
MLLYRRLALSAALALLPVAAGAAEFALPIDCTPGSTCFIQKYVDVDPGEVTVDHACGTLSSPAHKGTDFRVLPGASADVVAAAPGTVKAVRDGMADNVFADEITVPSDRACGNGVLIDHGGGVETLSCHLSPGTLRVAVGDPVETGTVLGRVGASGQAAFRHVHFQIIDNGRVVDPFTGFAIGEAACDTPGTPLWSGAAGKALADTPRTAILAAGFADGPVAIPDIQDGTLAPVAAGAGALVGYGLVFGPEAGDRHRLVLQGPGIAVRQEVPQERAQAQSMRFAGKRLADGLAPGRYTLVYAIVRDGRVIDEVTRQLTIER